MINSVHTEEAEKEHRFFFASWMIAPYHSRSILIYLVEIWTNFLYDGF